MIKNIKILIALIIGIASFSLSAQVAVTTDGSSADGSAMLDVKSTTKGVLITRMTQSQRNSISSPATGLMIYQTDNTPGFYYYSGSGWTQLGANVDLSAYAEKTNVLELDNTSSYTPSANYHPATKLYVDNSVPSLTNYALKTDVLTKTNTSSYTPSSNYHPATKLYVDGKASQWTTSGSEIYYGNNVGIGITNPAKRLHVYTGSSGQSIPNAVTQLVVESNSYSGISFLSPSTLGSYILFGDEQDNQIGKIGYVHSNNRMYFGTNGSSSSIVINGSGNVSIGSSSEVYKLYVNGSAGGNSSWQYTSDKRFKKDIKPIAGALDKILALQGITFNWNKTVKTDMEFDNKNHIGFLAQDLEEVLPQVVFTADDEMQTKSVAYGDVVPVLVEAIKEQQQQIEALKVEMENLKSNLTK